MGIVQTSKDFIKAIFSEIRGAVLSALLFSGTGGAAMTYFAERFYSDLPLSIVIGLIFTVFLFTLMMLVRAWNVVPRLGQPAYTLAKYHVVISDEAEAAVQGWINAFAMTARRFPDPAAHFTYHVIPPSNLPVMVGRTRLRDRYITFQSTIELTEDVEFIRQCLGYAESADFQVDMAAEMARTKIPHALITATDNKTKQEQVFMRLEVFEPISDITESIFARRVDEVTCAQNLVTITQRKWKDRCLREQKIEPIDQPKRSKKLKSNGRIRSSRTKKTKE